MMAIIEDYMRNMAVYQMQQTNNPQTNGIWGEGLL